MKHVISAALALTMVLSIFAASGVSVLADEETEIDRIDLTVEGVAVGAKIDDVVVSVPADANYEVVEIRWIVRDYENGGEQVYNDYFDSVYVYNAIINVAPKEGYSLKSAVYYVNGQQADKLYGMEDPYHEGACAYDWHSIQVIREVNFSGVRAPVVGAAATIDSISIPEDAPYVFSPYGDLKWELLENGFSEEQDVFKENGYYMLSIRLFPKKGYAFPESEQALNVVIDDKSMTAVDVIVNPDDLSIYIHYNMDLMAERSENPTTPGEVTTPSAPAAVYDDTVYKNPMVPTTAPITEDFVGEEVVDREESESGSRTTILVTALVLSGIIFLWWILPKTHNRGEDV